MQKLNLKIVDKARPNDDPENRINNARKRFVENASLQLKMAQALANGKSMPEFEEQIKKDGKAVTVSKSPKPWWWHDLDGVFYLVPRYSNKPLFGKDKAIEIGNVKQLPKTLQDLIDAVNAGQLDNKLLECSRRK